MAGVHADGFRQVARSYAGREQARGRAAREPGRDRGAFAGHAVVRELARCVEVRLHAEYDGGPGIAPLLAGYKLRVTVQWREPHDPDGVVPLDSAFPLKLRLLKQLDPELAEAKVDLATTFNGSFLANVK